MEQWMTSYYSWTDFFAAAVVLWALYFVLKFLQQRLVKGQLLGGALQAKSEKWLHGIILLYEPFVILILILIFVFIQPVLHSFLLLLLLLAGFARLKDYLSGRLILFNPLVGKGKRLKVGKTEGVVAKISGIGLYLQTNEGLHFVNYSQLLTKGYAIVSGKEIGGYYQLVITTPEDNEVQQSIRDLKNRLLTTPYLNKDYEPELTAADEAEDQINARISVREEKHLNELLLLLKEWGYAIRISQK